MMDAPALRRTMSGGRSRFKKGIVTDGVIVRWGGTTSLSKGIDSGNKLVGDAIVDDASVGDPDSKLTTEPEDDQRKEPSIDPLDVRSKEPSTDPDRLEDAGVMTPVLRRFTEASRAPIENSVGGSFPATFALPKDCSWKELPKSRHVARMEAATVTDEGGACSHAASFILLTMMSNPVNTAVGGMTPRAESAAATTTGDATMRKAMKNATMKGTKDGGGRGAMKRLEVVEQEGNKLPKPCE